MNCLVAAVAAYLIGGIPFGYLLVKWRTGGDVRTQGSGNIGATNVLRTSGVTAGILTLLLDAGKGWLALYLTARLAPGSVACLSAAAVAVMLGHIFTPFLKFKGGKGVATFAGAFLYLTPAALAAITVVFVAFVWYSKAISLGSIMGAVTFPLAVWLIERPALVVVGAAVFTCGLVIYRHKGNLERLRAGTEPPFRWRRSGSAKSG